MLDEPQHRVREDVVEAVVGLRVATRRGAPGRSPPSGASTSNGAPPCSRGDLDVLVGHRRGDPDRVAVVTRGPVSAVTRPPPPRLTRSPSVLEGRPGRGWRRGRAVRRVGHLQHLVEDPQPVAQVARRQEVRAHVLLAARARAACPSVRVARGSRASARRTPRASRHEVAGLAVLDLQRDPADVAADERARPSRAPPTRSGRSPRASTSGSRTSACDWNALTSIAPTLLRLLRMWMSGSPSA